MKAIITRTGVKVHGEQAKVLVKIGIAKWEKDIETPDAWKAEPEKVVEKSKVIKVVEKPKVKKK